MTGRTPFDGSWRGHRVVRLGLLGIARHRSAAAQLVKRSGWLVMDNYARICAGALM